jgi:hypothetical protein
MNDQEKKDALFAMVQKFVADNGITCPESIYQRDSLVIKASVFMESAVEIVGFAESDDE